MNQKKSLKLKENLLGYGFLSPALILLLIFLVIPVCMVVYYAFTDYYLLTPDDRKFIGLENFIRLFKDPIFYIQTFYFINQSYYCRITALARVHC